MASSPKIHLIHGDCDYFVFKELKTIKKRLQEENVSVTEFFGSKSLYFDQILGALSTSDLFQNSSTIIVRDVMNERSFFPFVEELAAYINSQKELENNLYIVQFSKVLKTSKLYKAVNKVGVVNEYNQPKPAEILSLVKKGIKITPDAALLLVEYSNSNLFQIKNEIQKLQSYIASKKRDQVEVEDVEKVCVKSFSQNSVWGIGSEFLNYKLQTSDYTLLKRLMKNIDDLLLYNVPPMQILYTFYQNVLTAIRFKQAIDSGAIRSDRDAFSYGYFFAKEFYKKKNLMNLEALFELNSKILEVEYQIKSGELDEVLGVKKLVLVN